MGKLWVEVCVISARGLRRSSSFFKLKWFAVGWVDPESKYCTKMVTSGDTNPVWKMRFSTCADESEFENLGLTVEVYSREPVFLRQSLLGSVTVALKEFVDKYRGLIPDDVRKPIDETGSFHLRKKNSGKPVGFVDVSVRVSEEREEPSSSYLGNEGGINIDSGYVHPNHVPEPHHPYYYPATGTSYHMSRPPPPPPPLNGPHYPVSEPYYSPATGTGHHMSRPPPPPPLNGGYTPNLFPMNTNFGPSTYINMPSSSVARPGRVRPGVGMGVGAGALAAGAVIFGDDFMSGFDVPSINISTDPPF